MYSSQLNGPNCWLEFRFVTVPHPGKLALLLSANPTDACAAVRHTHPRMVTIRFIRHLVPNVGLFGFPKPGRSFLAIENVVPAFVDST